MIEAKERLSFADVQRLLGSRRGGKPLHYSTFQRWATAGLRGIRLRTVVQGGMRYTTEAWLDEFFAAVQARLEEVSEDRRFARSRAAEVSRATS